MIERIQSYLLGVATGLMVGLAIAETLKIMQSTPAAPQHFSVNMGFGDEPDDIGNVGGYGAR